MTKKLLSYILTFSLLFSVISVGIIPIVAEEGEIQVWNGDVSESLQGSGSLADPYLINNGADLAYMYESVQSGSGISNNKHFRLTADIYLNDTTKEDWSDSSNNPRSWYTSASGSDGTPRFQGHFDGNGHTVYGLYYQGSDGSQGLLPVMDSYTYDVSVKNLTVSDSFIVSTGNIIGVISPRLYSNGKKTAHFYNINITESVYVAGMGGDYVGGILGFSNCNADSFYQFYGCSVRANISNKSSKSYALIGYGTTSTVAKIEQCYTTSAYWYETNSNQGESAYIVSADAIMGSQAAKTTMPGLDWDKVWVCEENGYPTAASYDFVGSKGVAWSGYTAPYYAGGSGTEADPYIIETAEQLARVLKVDLTGNKYFKITTDIYLNDVSDENWNENSPRSWFDRAALSNTAFVGTIDGAGHTVYGLYYNGASIFGLIPQASDTTINNLRISKSDITSTSYIAAFIGFPQNTINFSKCIVDETVNITGSSDTAGFVAYGSPTLVIDSCAGLANISGATNVGSIVGDCWTGPHTISNSFGVGYPLDAKVGYSSNSPCYSTVGNIRDASTTVILENTDLMTGPNALANMSELKGFGTTETYPVIYQQGTKGKAWTGSTAADYAGGIGTEADPYIIETAEQLAKLVKEPTAETKGKYYKITADIKVNDTSSNDWKATAKPWFTYNSGSEIFAVSFQGTLDGGGHTISGLYYDGTDSYVALFPSISNSGVTANVNNLTIDNSYLNSTGRISAFAAYVYGNVTYDKCKVSENVTINGKGASGYASYGEGNVTISNSSALATVSGTECAGAFIGNVWSSTLTINNSFATNILVGDTSRTLNGSKNYSTVEDAFGTNFVESVDLMKGADARKNMPKLEWLKHWVVDQSGGFPLMTTPNPEGTVGEVWTGDVATKYAGGEEGTAEDPFIIKTAEQLAKLLKDENTSGKYYVLGADIKINDTSIDNWTQIAKMWFDTSQTAKFSGTLDGAGYTVSGIYYYGTGFSSLIPIVKGATIKNIRLSNSYLENTGSTNDHNVSGIASYINGALTVDSCIIDDTVTIKSGGTAAGIAGYGASDVTIKNCGVAANIIGSTRYGAMLGNFWGGTQTVNNCYSVGTTFSNYRAFTGSNNYSTEDCSKGTITKLSVEQMSGADARLNMPSLNLFGTTDTYPVIFQQGTVGKAWTGSIAQKYAGGSGTKANPYIIETAEQLLKLVMDTNTAGKYYTLSADIKLNDTSAENWTESAIQWLGYPEANGKFAGTLNGEFHSITGLYYNGNSSYFGLFPTLGNSGYTANINKVIIDYSYLKSANKIAAFVGYVNGAITYNDCVVGENVTISADYASGYGSWNTGDITVNNSAALANISGTTYGGAFFADVWSSTLKINNSIGIGAFSPRRSYTGSNNYGTVEDAYGISGANLVTVEQMKGAKALENMPELTGYFATDSFPVRYFEGLTGAPWSGAVAKEFASGTGTKADPYIILTAEQLAKMLSTASRNNHYILGTDIVLSDETTKNNWLDSSNALVFSGNFNGNGYVISGLYYDKTVTSAVNVGLIPVADGAYISSIVLKDSDIKVVTNAKADTYVGALVGYVQGSRTQLYSCYVAEDVSISNTRGSGVTANNAVGGFIGGGNAAPVTIDGCAYFGTIAANEYRYGTLFGNIWGGQEADRIVKNTITDANMTPSSYWSFVGEKNISTVASSKDIYNTFTVVDTLKGEKGFGYVDSIANWNDRYFGTEGYPMLSSLAKRYSDVNCDTTFDVTDMIMVRKFLVGISNLGFIDINNDGSKNVADLFNAKKKIDIATKPGGYELVWFDEFDGTALDSTKWSTQTRMSDTNELAQSNSGEVRTVKDGNLKLTAKSNPYYNANGTYFEQHQYMTTGSVTTENKMSYQYGYLEIRAKVPYKAGCWPSFWLRSHNAKKEGTTKFETEVDVFEVFGSADTMTSNLHQQNYNGQSYQTGGGMFDLNDINNEEKHTIENTDEYHLYAFEWTPNSMAVYVDGVLNVEWKFDWLSLWDYGLKNNTTGFNTPMNILFNNHLFTESSEFKPSTGTIENNEGNLPAEFDIDYVRLYQKNDGVSKLYIGE